MLVHEILPGLKSVLRRRLTDYFRIVTSSFYLSSSFRKRREAKQTANHNSYAHGKQASQNDA